MQQGVRQQGNEETNGGIERYLKHDGNEVARQQGNTKQEGMRQRNNMRQ